MSRYKNYWLCRAGLALVWGILLILVFRLRGPAVGQNIVLLFAGFCIGWVSTMIARFVYPPHKRWGTTQHIS